MATVGPLKGKGDGVRSEDVRRGVPVRVVDPVKRSGRGRTGTIERMYDHPSELLADDATNATRFHRGGGWNPDNLYRSQG